MTASSTNDVTNMVVLRQRAILDIYWVSVGLLGPTLVHVSPFCLILVNVEDSLATLDHSCQLLASSVPTLVFQ